MRISLVYYLILLNANLIFANNNKEKPDQLKIYQQQLLLCNNIKDPKARETCKNNILLLIKQEKENKEKEDNKEEHDDTIQILTIFASVVANFGKIIIDPNNPENVSSSIYSMLAGMINIASTLTRSHKKISEFSEQDIKQIVNNLDSKTKKDLSEILQKEAYIVRKRCLK